MNDEASKPVTGNALNGNDSGTEEVSDTVKVTVVEAEVHTDNNAGAGVGVDSGVSLSSRETTPGGEEESDRKRNK